MSVAQREPGWIYNRKWDLTLIIFSSALVPLPFLVAWGAQATGWMTQAQAIDAINIVVSLLIGGPHLFSTISYTFLDNNFRAKHGVYAKLALLIPPIVVYLGRDALHRADYFLLHLGLAACAASNHLPDRLLPDARRMGRPEMVATGGLRSDPHRALPDRDLQDVARAVQGGRRVTSLPRFSEASAAGRAGGRRLRRLS